MNRNSTVIPTALLEMETVLTIYVVQMVHVQVYPERFPAPGMQCILDISEHLPPTHKVQHSN